MVMTLNEVVRRDWKKFNTYSQNLESLFIEDGTRPKV